MISFIKISFYHVLIIDIYQPEKRISKVFDSSETWWEPLGTNGKNSDELS